MRGSAERRVMLAAHFKCSALTPQATANEVIE
jgi:hypothetical protein